MDDGKWVFTIMLDEECEKWLERWGKRKRSLIIRQLIYEKIRDEKIERDAKKYAFVPIGHYSHKKNRHKAKYVEEMVLSSKE